MKVILSFLGLLPTAVLLLGCGGVKPCRPLNVTLASNYVGNEEIPIYVFECKDGQEQGCLTELGTFRGDFDCFKDKGCNYVSEVYVPDSKKTLTFEAMKEMGPKSTVIVLADLPNPAAELPDRVPDRIKSPGDKPWRVVVRERCPDRVALRFDRYPDGKQFLFRSKDKAGQQ